MLIHVSKGAPGVEIPLMVARCRPHLDEGIYGPHGG